MTVVVTFVAFVAFVPVRALRMVAVLVAVVVAMIVRMAVMVIENFLRERVVFHESLVVAVLVTAAVRARFRLERR